MTPRIYPIFLAFFLAMSGCLGNVVSGFSDDGLVVPAIDSATETVDPDIVPTDEIWVIEQRIENYAVWRATMDGEEHATLIFDWVPDDADGYLVVSGVVQAQPRYRGFDSQFANSGFIIPNNDPDDGQTLYYILGGDAGPQEILLFVEAFGSPGELRAALRWGEGDAQHWVPESTGQSKQHVEEMEFTSRGVHFEQTFDMEGWTSAHFAFPCVSDPNRPAVQESMHLRMGTKRPNLYDEKGEINGSARLDWSSQVSFWTYTNDSLPVAFDYEGTRSPQAAILLSDAPWSDFLGAPDRMHVRGMSGYCTVKPLDGDGDDDEGETW